MAHLPPSLLAAMSREPGLWPGPLLDEGSGELAEAVGGALAALPEGVLASILAAVEDRERNPWGRAALLGLDALARGGARPTRMRSSGLIEVEDRAGRLSGVVPLSFSAPAQPAGRPQDVARLGAALDNTFGRRQYVLYLRRPVPEAFDPAPIARAVHLWLGAIDRGEWQGNHAIYEDSDVALELTLTGSEAPTGGRARVFTVGPVTALERLAEVDNRLVGEVSEHAEAVGDLPLVVVLSSERPWRMPRGYVEQLLYGTADEVRTLRTDTDSSYSARFSPNGRSLFADPACRNIMALVWLEPGGPSPLGARAWAHHNPWSTHAAEVPELDCSRFAPVDTDEARAGTVMRWLAAEAR